VTRTRSHSDVDDVIERAFEFARRAAEEIAAEVTALTERLRSIGSVGAEAPRATKEPVRMTESDIDKRLREFERTWTRSSGETLTSEAFYARYCSGDFDTRFGALWATYYEAATELRAAGSRQPMETAS
jgi:hypothetical protein